MKVHITGLKKASEHNKRDLTVIIGNSNLGTLVKLCGTGFRRESCDALMIHVIMTVTNILRLRGSNNVLQAEPALPLPESLYITLYTALRPVTRGGKR